MQGTLKSTSMGCFLMGVTGIGWTKDGSALIGSVSDDPYDIRTFVKSVHVENGFSHVGTELISTSRHTLTERGYFARPGETTRGTNEKGLSFTCAMVIEVEDDPEKPSGLTHYADVTEEMMRTCETVEDAIRLFQSYGSVQPAYSVILADARGGLAHLEVGSYGISVFAQHSQENPGAVLAVNCYRTPRFISKNSEVTRMENKQNNNLTRYTRGLQALESLKGQFTVEKVIELLSDHVNREIDPLQNPVLPGWGYSICNHGTRGKDDYPEEDLPWGTVSAEIMHPAENRFWYTYGWSCGGPKEYGDQLFQENTWRRFLPFSILASSPSAPGTFRLTTNDGYLTANGIHYLSL